MSDVQTFIALTALGRNYAFVISDGGPPLKIDFAAAWMFILTSINGSLMVKVIFQIYLCIFQEIFTEKFVF